MCIFFCPRYMKLVKLQEYNGTSYFIYVTHKNFFHKTVFLIKLQLMFNTYILYENYFYTYIYP